MSLQSKSDFVAEVERLRAVVASLLAELEQSRAKALEEAAKAAEDCTDDAFTDWRGEFHSVPKRIAAAIRALAEPKTPPPPTCSVCLKNHAELECP